MGYMGTVRALGEDVVFKEPKEANRERCMSYAMAVEATRPVKFDLESVSKTIDWIVERASYSKSDAVVEETKARAGKTDAAQALRNVVAATEKTVGELEVVKILAAAAKAAEGKDAYIRVEPLAYKRWRLVLETADGVQIWVSDWTEADVTCVRPLHGDVCSAAVVLSDAERAGFGAIADVVPGRAKSNAIERLVAEAGADARIAIEGGY